MQCSWLIVIMLFLPFTISAQDAGGVVKGKVKDSSYNFVLGSATVAVYKKAGNMLLQFSIPNNLGEFTVSKLPFNDTLQMQVTHVGYAKYEKDFILRPDKSTLDFGWIYLRQYANAEDEVVVTGTIAPVRMNGDTLEFNPRAFKMQTDASAEDLMRRLPGFTIWSDGTITFNGKEIKALFVDGKPFMGGKDVTIATQNLPKDALDKVQVYQQYNEKNPLDSALMANLKMKDAKKMGYFGKLGMGYGTGNRYAADAMLAGFNKKLQVNAVVAANNINKIAKDLDVLIRNNSFKGEGNNIDYQPDFNLPGINKPISGGIRFQYDFITDPVYLRNERINANYFIDHNNVQVKSSAIVRTILKPDSFLVRRTANSNSSVYTRQNFNSLYIKNDRTKAFSIGFDGGIDYNRTLNTGTDEQERTGLGVVGNGNFSAESREFSSNGLLTLQFTKRSDWYNSSYQRHKRIPTDFTLRYSFGFTSAEGSGRNQSTFTNFATTGPPAIQAFDRLYAKRDNELRNSTVYVQYPYLRQLLFGEKRLGNIDMKLGGNFVLEHNNYIDIVADLDTLSKKYVLNQYLTNKRRESITDLQPEAIIFKQFQRNLTNRYSKYIILEAIARSQYYSNRNNATQSIQKFSYNYARFIPQFSFIYNNHQFGKREVKLSVKYESLLAYPAIQHIAPLVDSTNLWVLPMGNPHIKPEYNNKYSIIYLFESRKSKNPYSFGFNFEYISTKDKMTDSTIYDATGRLQVYPVNTSGYHYWNVGVHAKKAYNPDKYNTFEFSARYNVYRYIVPQYINDISIISKSLAHNIDGQVGYTYRHIVNLKIQQGVNFYNNEQYGDDRACFNSNVFYTRIAGTVLLFNQLLCSSNITYSNSSVQNTPSIEYTIWNASLAYRFLNGKRGEIKFSALDLLKQNKSVINLNERNVQTFGYTNVLQQYFLLSLAYYPRKFGK